MKVLLELRPALDGYSGIPQETRLLFRGLASMPGIEPVGLIQSSNLAVEAGLPVGADGRVLPMPGDERVDRLSRIVVSLQQGAASHRFEYMRKRGLKLLGPTGAVLGSMLGGRVRLGAFEPERFRDFVWRSMFAKSLPERDFDAVTGAAFRVLRWPWSSLHALGVATSWLGSARYARLDTAGIDVVIAETPFPARVRAPTRLVVRYHDAIPLLMPHTIKDRGYHRSAHYQALRRNARDGAWFACVSDATRRDLLSVVPELEARSETIANMVSHHFHPHGDGDGGPAHVPEIVWSRKNRSAPGEGGAPIDPGDLSDGALSYLLVVGTIEPRKNHLALIDAWERLRTEGQHRLHLVIVGALGWDHQAIVARLSPWLGRGGLHLLADVPADDLRLLYRHAAATVCPSFGEGFDFPGIEAMRSGGVVAASDIPVHRDVFGDGCAWFNPYAPAELAHCLRSLIGAEAGPRRRELIECGARIAARYLPEKIVPQWAAFLQKVAAAPAGARAA